MASLVLISASAPAGAGPTGWAHQAAGFQSNGAVTVKSLSGGSYAGTQNPTGAAAKANQNAVTQAPTVVIQATGNSGVVVALTKAKKNGNLGGVAGATAMCVAEFGSGWKFAHTGQVHLLSTAPAVVAWIDGVVGSCQNGSTNLDWTNAASTTTGAVIAAGSSTGYFFSPSIQSTSCNNPLPVACTNF